MPTYTVKKGDTMWALAARMLEERTGRKPTNAAINRVVKNARVPGSGDKNKIKPGDKITFSYTAGGGSGRRGENSASRGSTKAERFRYSERGATKKTTAARKSAQIRRFREGERASTGGRSSYRAPGSSADNRTRIQDGNKKKNPPKKRTAPSTYRAPGSASENRARIEASRPKKKKSKVMARAQTTAYARSKARYPGA